LLFHKFSFLAGLACPEIEVYTGFSI